MRRELQIAGAVLAMLVGLLLGRTLFGSDPGCDPDDHGGGTLGEIVCHRIETGR